MHQLGTLIHRCAKYQVSSLSHLARMAVHRRRQRQRRRQRLRQHAIAIGSFRLTPNEPKMQRSQSMILPEIGDSSFIMEIPWSISKFFLLLSLVLTLADECLISHIKDTSKHDRSKRTHVYPLTFCIVAFF